MLLIYCFQQKKKYSTYITHYMYSNCVLIDSLEYLRRCDIEKSFKQKFKICIIL